MNYFDEFEKLFDSKELDSPLEDPFSKALGILENAIEASIEEPLIEEMNPFYDIGEQPELYNPSPDKLVLGENQPELKNEYNINVSSKPGDYSGASFIPRPRIGRSASGKGPGAERIKRILLPRFNSKAKFNSYPDFERCPLEGDAYVLINRCFNCEYFLEYWIYSHCKFIENDFFKGVRK